MYSDFVVSKRDYQYLTQIYKETKESAVEHYDKVVVIPEQTEESKEE